MSAAAEQRRCAPDSNPRKRCASAQLTHGARALPLHALRRALTPNSLCVLSPRLQVQSDLAVAQQAPRWSPSTRSTSTTTEYSGPGRRHLRGGAARAVQLTHLPRLRRRRWRPAEEGLRVGSGCWAGAEPAGARPTGRARGACGPARGGKAAQGGAGLRTALRNECHPRGWEGVRGHVGGAGMAMCVVLRSNRLGVP